MPLLSIGADERKRARADERPHQECILAHRERQGDGPWLEYLLSHDGYADAHNSWETAETLESAESLRVYLNKVIADHGLKP